MTISNTAAFSVSATSTVSFGVTAAAGDLILVCALAGVTNPGLPTGYTSIVARSQTYSGNTYYWNIAYKIATGGETSVTFPGAGTNYINGVIYRPSSGGLAIGATASADTANALTTSTTIPALTLQNTSGSSWVAGLAAFIGGTLSLPGSLTTRGSSANTFQKTGDTNAGVSSWAASTATNTSNVPAYSASIEIKETAITAVLGTSGSTTRAWVPNDYAGTVADYSSKTSAEYTISGGVVTTMLNQKSGGSNATLYSSPGSALSTLDGTQPAFYFDYSAGTQFRIPYSSRPASNKRVWAALVNLSSSIPYQAIFGADAGSGGFVLGVDSGQVFLDILETVNIFRISGFTYNTTQLIVVTRDDATGAYELRINGTSIATGSYSAPGGTSSYQTYLSGVYDRDYMYGTVAQVVLGDNYTSTTAELLEGAILHRWGKQSLLPTGHTYKTAAPTTTISSGSPSAQEANDTLSATATVQFASSATLAITQVNDTLSATSTLSISATTASTQGQDTLSSTAQLALGAALNVTLANDTLSANALLEIRASTAATEASDTLSATGTLLITGDANGTEGNDTLSATSQIASTDVNASVALTEADDTVTASSKLEIQASASPSEANDTLSAISVGLSSVAAVGAQEAPDTASGQCTLAIRVSVAAVEQNDTLASAAAITDLPRFSTLDSVELNDTLLSNASLDVIWNGDGEGGGLQFAAAALRFTYSVNGQPAQFAVPSRPSDFSEPARPRFIQPAR